MKPRSLSDLETLIAAMTTEEKIGQLNQLCGPFEKDFVAIRAGSVGSFVLAGSATAGSDEQKPVPHSFLNKLQRVAVEESRLGIPLLFARDVIHGFRTVFPIPLGCAASWSPDLVQQAYRVAGQEARAHGVRWSFAPMMDVSRDPRWGRVAEGFGEDPLLVAALACAAVRGLQGASDEALRQEGVAGCAKHYVGYSAPEGGREYAAVDMSPATLREVYLPPFEAAIGHGVATVMSAFHDLNGTPITASRAILTELLREELGFTGVVVSDWNSVAELISHGLAADLKEAATLAFQAGVEIDMVSGAYAAHLVQVIQQPACLARLDSAVRRVLELKWRVGLFEDPYLDLTKASQAVPTPTTRQIARSLAAQSIVLLKNDAAVLPIREAKKIAVVGSLADSCVAPLGTWSLDGRPEDVVSVLQGIRAAAGSDCEVVAPAEFGSSVPRYILEQAEVIIAVVGEHPIRSGEGGSIASLELPPGERELLGYLASIGRPVVAVVLAGRPVVMDWEREVAAIVYGWHSGIECGSAIASILFGSESPSGKLPMTIPRHVGQVPIYYSLKSSGRPLGAEPVRWASQYIDISTSAHFPFGFGLSYTTFGYSDLHCTPLKIAEQERFQLTVTVTNTGTVRGREIVQLYARDLHASCTRPIKELKAFTSVTLDPGESAQVPLAVPARSLGFFNGKRYQVEHGLFELQVGPHSQQGLSVVVEVAG